MLSRSEVEALAAAASNEERSLGRTIAGAARLIARQLDRPYATMSQEQRDLQARLTAVVAVETTPDEIYQLHQVMHLLHGYSKRMWPDPAVEQLRRYKAPEHVEKPKPDVIIREIVTGGHGPSSQGHGADGGGEDHPRDHAGGETEADQNEGQTET